MKARRGRGIGLTVAAFRAQLGRFRRSRRGHQPGGPSAPSSPVGAGAFGFPLFLEVRGRLAFVAGGGHVAAGKAETLVELGAQVRLWAPTHRATRRLAGRASVELVEGDFAPDLLDGASLAIAATGEPSLDRQIAVEARRRHVLVNVHDGPSLSDWSAPAVLRRGDLTVAIGTGGVAPALAVRLRDRLAGELGPEYGELLALLGQARSSIAATDRPFADRRTVWYALVDGPALDHLRSGRPDAARRVVEVAIATWKAAP